MQSISPSQLLIAAATVFSSRRVAETLSKTVSLISLANLKPSEVLPNSTFTLERVAFLIAKAKTEVILLSADCLLITFSKFTFLITAPSPTEPNKPCEPSGIVRLLIV